MTQPSPPSARDDFPLLVVELRHEDDVVLARQRARELVEGLGLDTRDQTRFATAVSEIARNARRHAGGGRVEFVLEGLGEDGAPGPQRLHARVIDRGPGIPHLDAVLSGRASAGMGIACARRLTDAFEVECVPNAGTRVTLTRILPPRSGVTRAVAARVAAVLAARGAAEPMAELATQNRELARTLDELRTRQEDIERLNRELEETNRGVLALYAELDERAKELKRASEMKTSFLSNVSHELRTPLTSILNISRLMLEHSRESMSDEQRRQLGFVRSAAQSLSEIVNDLLDLAKIEAGRVDVRPAPVELSALFGTLRGMFRPLVASDAVTLVFEPPPPLALVTDEARLAQILRNLVSNALKYTDHGEVRVRAAAGAHGTVRISVTDTGIGIPPAMHEQVFSEFVQVEGPHQRRVKGTGLGLPLSRQLARLLGGTVSLESTPGEGSTFTLTIPLEDTRGADTGPAVDREWRRSLAQPTMAGGVATETT